MAVLIRRCQDGQGSPGPGECMDRASLALRDSWWDLRWGASTGMFGHFRCLGREPDRQDTSCGALEVADVPVTNPFAAGDTGRGPP